MPNFNPKAKKTSCGKDMKKGKAGIERLGGFGEGTNGKTESPIQMAGGGWISNNGGVTAWSPKRRGKHQKKNGGEAERRTLLIAERLGRGGGSTHGRV